MTHRIEKVESTLTRAIQQVIGRGLNDPRAGGLITVTSVTVSPDLKNATVNISILPEEKSKLTMHALVSAARHIRREAGELVALNKMPELTFRLDMSLEKQAEVFGALARARESGKKDGETESAGNGEEKP